MTCGGGVQARTVQCLVRGKPSAGCALHLKPPMSQACNTNFCPQPEKKGTDTSNVLPPWCLYRKRGRFKGVNKNNNPRDATVSSTYHNVWLVACPAPSRKQLRDHCGCLPATFSWEYTCSISLLQCCFNQCQMHIFSSLYLSLVYFNITINIITLTFYLFTHYPTVTVWYHFITN